MVVGVNASAAFPHKYEYAAREISTLLVRDRGRRAVIFTVEVAAISLDPRR